MKTRQSIAFLNKRIPTLALRCGLALLLAVPALSFVVRRCQTAAPSPAGSPAAETVSLPELQGAAAADYIKQQGLHASLGKAMAEARYSVWPLPARAAREAGEQFSANNPRQRYRSYFANNQVRLVTGEREQLRFRLKGWGYGARLLSAGPGRLSRRSERVEIRREARRTQPSAISSPQLTEWYVNRREGLEQGFTLDTPPGERQGGERLYVVLEVDGDLRAELAADGETALFKNARGEVKLRYGGLKVWDAAQRQLPATLVVRESELSLEVDDGAARYPLTIDPLIDAPETKLEAGDRQAGDEFGSTVGISGDTAVVGAYLEDDPGTNSGAAYVFQRNQGGADLWGQVAKLEPTDKADGDRFGYAVAISQDTVIVGAPQKDDQGADSGATYLFSRNQGGANAWGQLTKLIPEHNYAGNRLGSSVSISGGWAVVGVPQLGTTSTGYAEIFGRTANGVWVHVRTIAANDPEAGAQFGFTVSISGDDVLVGAPFKDDFGPDSGAAYFFVRQGPAAWGQVAKLEPGDKQAGDRFGLTVSLNGTTAIVGAPRNDNPGLDSGAAYIFERSPANGNVWQRTRKLAAEDKQDGDEFGTLVSISGDTVVVGAHFEDDPGSNSGAAYIFKRNKGGANVWGQDAKLEAGDKEAGDLFGAAVGISGNTVIVGAPAEDDPGMDSGAAYVFSVPNNTPTMMAQGVTLPAGGVSLGTTLANVNDVEDAENTLTVTVNDGASAMEGGIKIENLAVSAAGVLTAKVTTTCDATEAGFSLKVTDSGGRMETTTLTVTVIANTPPVLSYNPVSNFAAGRFNTMTVNPAATPSDNGAVASFALQSQGSFKGEVSVNSQTGAVRLTQPYAIGTHTITVRATDNCGATAIANLIVTVVCPDMTLTPATLPIGKVNVFYSQIMGGEPGPFLELKVTSGLLPPGMSVGHGFTSQDRALIGTPTQSGIYHFRLTMTNFGSCSGFRDYVIVVNCADASLGPDSLSGGRVGAGYSSSTFSASPAGSYTYSVTSGALPPGLTLNNVSGDLTGVPATAGMFRFRITASAGGCTVSRDYAIDISCPTIGLGELPIEIPSGTGFNQTISVSPPGSYSFSLVNGSLLPGLTLNRSTGAISGTPATNSETTFVVRAQGASGCDGARTYRLRAACVDTITLRDLPTPELQSHYIQVVSALPADRTYRLELAAGALPAGLSFDPAYGLISGVPTMAGNYSFTLRATALGGCTGSRIYSGTIASGNCPPLTLTPTTLPSTFLHSLYSQSISVAPAGNYSFAVTSGSLPPGIQLFGAFGLLYGSPTAKGTYNFTITVTDLNNCTSSHSYSLPVN